MSGAVRLEYLEAYPQSPSGPTRPDAETPSFSAPYLHGEGR